MQIKIFTMKPISNIYPIKVLNCILLVLVYFYFLIQYLTDHEVFLLRPQSNLAQIFILNLNFYK